MRLPRVLLLVGLVSVGLALGGCKMPVPRLDQKVCRALRGMMQELPQGTLSDAERGQVASAMYGWVNGCAKGWMHKFAGPYRPWPKLLAALASPVQEDEDEGGKIELAVRVTLQAPILEEDFTALQLLVDRARQHQIVSRHRHAVITSWLVERRKAMEETLELAEKRLGCPEATGPFFDI